MAKRSDDEETECLAVYSEEQLELEDLRRETARHSDVIAAANKLANEQRMSIESLTERLAASQRQYSDALTHSQRAQELNAAYRKIIKDLMEDL